MAFRGITFDKQVLQSKDHAHEVNYYFQGDKGVTNGCNTTTNVDGNLVISDGYFIIYGRLIKIEGDEIINVPDVASGVLYSILVFEIDLTKLNTPTEFNQGTFKIISNSTAYPALTQQDLINGGNVYQMEFARFQNTVSGVTSLVDSKTVLDMNKYVKNTELGSLLGPIIQALTSKATPVDADAFMMSDSAAANGSKKLTWANFKTALKAYLDSFYATITNLNLKAPLAAPALTGNATLDGRRIISNNVSTGTAVYQVWSGTQAQYDAIESKDSNTIYFIV